MLILSVTSSLTNAKRDEARVTHRRPRSWIVFVVSFALSLAAMLAWSLATPISAVPDEPTHFIRAAAVVRGELNNGPFASIPWQTAARVPNYIAHTGQVTCFAFQPSVTASCQTGVVGDPDKMVTVGQTAQTNSPLFYAIVGLPSVVWSGDLALYSMRGVNALLCALLIGFTFASVSQLARSRFALLATFIAMTPMMLFLGGSVNPNAVEATAAVSLFAALTLLLTRAGSRRQVLSGLGVVVVSTALLTGTRSISLLWVLLALVAAVLLGKPNIISRVARMPVVWIAAAICVFICAAELLWFLQPSVTAPAPVPGDVISSKAAFLRMFVNTFDYASGAIGLFGWIDTPAPAITIGAWTVAIVAIVIPAFVLAHGRARWGVLMLGGAFILTPAVSQAVVAPTSGYIWQGRYTLAVLAMLLVACGMCIDRLDTVEYAVPKAYVRAARTSLVIVLVALAIGQLAAFVTTLQRYTVGADKPLPLMLMHPQWQPPLGWVQLTIVFGITVVGSGFVVAHTVLPIRSHANSFAVPSLGPE